MTDLERIKEELEAWLVARDVDLILYTSGGTGDILLEDRSTLESIVVR